MKNKKYKDSGIPWIGMIPEDWEVKRLKHIANKITKGNGITKEEVFADGETPCVRYGEIYSKYENSFSQCFSRTRKENLSALHFFHYGDILCAGTGELVEEIGKSIIYLGNENCLAGGDIIILSPNQNPIFLNFALNSKYVQSQKSCGKAKLKVVHISASDIGNLLIALPPLPTQQRIADFLDRKCAEIDELAALQETMIAELKRYKQSVITEAVTKGLDKNVKMKDSGVEWIGEVPEGWEVRRMKNICSPNPNSLTEKEKEDFEFDYVDIGSVSFEKGIYKTEHYVFRDAPSRARRKTQYGDMIVSTVRTYLRAIDIIDSEEKANYIYSTGFAVLTPFDECDYRFLSFISKSQAFLEQVSILSRGINYPSINTSDLLTIFIASPPLTEQRTIADYLDRKCGEIDELIAIKQQKIEQLKEYKKSVIFEYVTGKKEVER